MSLNYKEDGELKPLTKTEVVSNEPIGMIISFMGKNAPAGYLICDGSEYNIADYEKLAEHFENEFGAVNNFGGDGTTTFAVPDLRGEFLRGTGTNGHTNQGNGAAVGVHQNATQHIKIGGGTTNNLYIYPNNAIWYGEGDSDATASIGNNTIRYATLNNSSAQQNPTYYTSRPTNTSVLYCIKYM